jgi:hypothetical protein
MSRQEIMGLRIVSKLFMLMILCFILMWTEVIVAYFKVVFQNFHGETKKSHKKPQDIQPQDRESNLVLHVNN